MLQHAYTISIVTALIISILHRSSGFAVVPVRSRIQLYSLLKATSDRQYEETDVTITVPRFSPEEVKEGSYPSVLHSIHVQTFLSEEEAAMCLKLAKSFAAETGSWKQPDSMRHHTYATCDFAVEESENLASYLEDISFNKRMWKRLSELYGVDDEDMTYIDLFCANYQARDDAGNTSTMDRLEPHRDGSLLSFSVVLSPPENFVGGGTFFEALRGVVPASEAELKVLFPPTIRTQRAGDCVMHSGKLLHGADVITSGERTVLVGFVDVADWCQHEGVLAEACRNFGRMDVADYRYKRQKSQADQGNTNGWKLRNERWLPKSNVESETGRSYVRGSTPAFPSVVARAKNDYQRMKKLEAEDILLRSILLPEKKQPLDSLFGGEITVL